MTSRKVMLGEGLGDSQEEGSLAEEVRPGDCLVLDVAEVDEGEGVLQADEGMQVGVRLYEISTRLLCVGGCLLYTSPSPRD